MGGWMTPKYAPTTLDISIFQQGALPLSNKQSAKIIDITIGFY
jgi:hypothetical protein